MKPDPEIYHGVTPDGLTMHIEFIVGPSLELNRKQALLLLEAIQAELPNMAVEIGR